MSKILAAHIKTLSLFLIISMLYSPASNAQTQLFMAGDSTMSIKRVTDYPETGWGMPFASFFSSELEVVNLAKNGRSTKTFISEGLWGKITDSAKKGDFVIIQFGHNDQSENKVDRYTTPEQYKNNLTRMITEAQNKGASVILMTPITRRTFTAPHRISSTHPYASIVKTLASELKLSFIDMEKLTQEYFQEMGDLASQLRFMHIPSDTHPNYPKGVRDNTHLNELGAREVAQLVFQALKKMKHPLLEYAVTPDPHHLSLSY